jgi:hypothetical protein
MDNSKTLQGMLQIEQRIFTIRGLQVMLDSDLAELYGVETKRLNEQVRRNEKRFPGNFRFQLTTKEKDELVAICDRLNRMKHSTARPHVFTEHGVAMLSAVLKSSIAIEVSIQIIEAFVLMRKMNISNQPLIQRIKNLENHQKENNDKFDMIFKALANHKPIPETGLFFNGQVFDAWMFVSDLIRSAVPSIVLIDNYLDDTVLKLLAKRKPGVAITLFTQKITPQLSIEAEKFNRQYGELEIRQLTNCHDRFLIIDETALYHIGASLKDLGKSWFAFSKIDTLAPSVLGRLKESKCR